MSSSRAFAAAFTALAVMAALYLPCPCAPSDAVARAGEHDCCAPPAGVSAADRGCCSAASPVKDATPGPSTLDAAPVQVASLAAARPAAGLRVPLRSTAALSPSPPPLVLRI